MKHTMKLFGVSMLLVFAILLAACGGTTAHVHEYTDTWVAPTVDRQGYHLHTCSCGDSYTDGFTGLAGEDELVAGLPKYNVLFVGNSYTYCNSLYDLVRRIAVGQGYTFTYAQVTKGSYYLTQFASDSDTYGKKVQAELNKKTHNLVILQEQSVRPAINANEFYKGVAALIDKIEPTGADVLLYQTWGRKAGHETLTKYGMTTETMAKKLAAAYEAAAEAFDCALTPAGSAMLDVYRNHPEIELYNTDKSHPSPTGSYLVALCMYATIYGKSPVGVTYTGSIPADVVPILQQAAERAVFGPSIVTEEYRTTVPAEYRK